MKALPKLALALAALLTCATGVIAADAAAQLLTEAQAAYKQGDLKAAKAKFLSVTSLDPKNQTAITYLRKIQTEEAEKGGSGDRNLTKLILPSVQFREADLSAVLEALRQQVAKVSNGQQAVNFVAQLSEAQAKTPITLSLTNVPFPEVLKYIGTLAGVTFTFDKYAIMVRPASGGAPAPEPKTEELPKVKGL